MVAKLFFDLSIKEGRVDFQKFEQDAIEIAEKHWTGGSFQDMDIGSFLMDLAYRAMQHKVHAPPSYTMFFKGVMTTEGLAKSLLPEVDPLQAAQPFVEQLIRKRWQPQQLSDISTYNLSSYGHLINRLPISIGQLLDDFDHQRFLIRVQHEAKLSEKKYQHTLLFTRWLLYLSMFWVVIGLSLFFIPYLFIYDAPILGLVCIVVGIMMQLGSLLALYLTKEKE